MNITEDTDIVHIPNSTGDVVCSEQELWKFCGRIDPDDAVRGICKIEKTVLFGVLCSCSRNSSRIAHFFRQPREEARGE